MEDRAIPKTMMITESSELGPAGGRPVCDTVIDRIPKIFGGTYKYSQQKWREDLQDLMEMVDSPLPLALEIGFAKGRFLLGTGAANPDLGFIGIESRRKWIPYVREQCQKHGITNVAVAQGDAHYLLPMCIPDGRLQEVFVLFPDPWWKERHQKKRLLLTDDFLKEIARTIKPGGLLTLKTDVARYADAVLETVASLPCYTHINNTDATLANTTSSPVATLTEQATMDDAESPTTIQTCDKGILTNREVRITEARLPIYHHTFRRNM